jgi:hypothetical protein
MSGAPSLYPTGGWKTEDRLAQTVRGGPSSGAPKQPTKADSLPKTVDILRVKLNGILNSEIRHLIKRYLRDVGFTSVKVVHLSDCGPSTMTLLVTGQVDHDLSDEEWMKMKTLDEALTRTLTRPTAGLDPHPSHADPEMLRKELTPTDPALNKLYFTRA